MSRWSRHPEEAEHLALIAQRVADACSSGCSVRLQLRDGTVLRGTVVDERQSYDPLTGNRRGSLGLRRWAAGHGSTLTTIDILDVSSIETVPEEPGQPPGAPSA